MQGSHGDMCPCVGVWGVNVHAQGNNRRSVFMCKAAREGLVSMCTLYVKVAFKKITLTVK